MAVLACLGRVNYWVTLPFLGFMVVLLVFGLIWPRKLPDVGKRRWPPWAIRLGFSLCLVLVVGVFVPSALGEARHNLDCAAVEAARSRATATVPERLAQLADPASRSTDLHP